MRELPAKIVHHPDAPRAFDVVLSAVAGAHGFIEAHDFKIVIDPNQPLPEQWIILFHELLHLVESSLLEGGIIKRRVTHDFVTHAAPLLFGMLAMSGLLEGISAAEAKRFVRRWIREATAAAGK